MRRKLLLVIAAATTTAAALGVVLTAASEGNAKAKPQTRTIYMSAVEWKGSANISKEAYPTQALPEGGGYESFAPGHPEVASEAGKWAVETYRFDTALIAACAGDKVVLKIFGVNAKEHHITIPDFNRDFVVRRRPA